MTRLWAALVLSASASTAMAGDQPFAPPAPQNDKEWLRSTDLSMPAFKRIPHGSVQMIFQVSTEGRVTECTTVRTSGDAELDETICNLVVQRARFRPAGNPNGDAVPGGHRRTISW
jgi:TonB family protein